MGFTVLYLGLVVLLPLSALAVTGLGLPWEKLWAAASAPRTVAAFRLSLSCAAAAAVATALLGLLVAWALVRYPFPGRRLVDALVDLPFALPTAVAGVTLTALYAESGWLGGPLSRLGIKVAHTPLGIALALVFIGLPFVVRTVQPVLEDLDPELEDAARSLGASRLQTFRKVLLPEIAPALLTGATLAFARGLGEYGSVIFIAGNMPGKTEIVPLLVLIKLEQYDYAGAASVALASLLLSFALLLALNLLQGPRGLLDPAGRRKGGAP
jgi:sulfate transport system permease protein